MPELRGKFWLDAMIHGHVLAAIKGSTQAVKEITDRIEGKVKDELEVKATGEFTTAVSEAYARARGRK